MKRLIWNSILLLFIFFTAPAEGFGIETYDYLERIDTLSVKIFWQLEEKKDHIILRSIRAGEIHIYQCDLLGATLQWELKNPGTNTDIVARREKRSILINGTFEGESIDKKVSIDGAPWYQPMSFSLTSFIKSDKSSVEFWSLRPNDLLSYKMKAKKKEIQLIKIHGKEVEVQKVKVSLTGFRSMFWHGYYWFRKVDGLFMKYEGVNGPPGTPKTIIELIREGN